MISTSLLQAPSIRLTEPGCLIASLAAIQPLASAPLRRSLLGNLDNAFVPGASRPEFNERRTIRSASFSPCSRKASPVRLPWTPLEERDN